MSLAKSGVLHEGRSRTSVHDKLFVALFGGLIVLAWMSLLVWGRSPYARFLDHGHLGELSFGNGYLVMLFVAGWTLMIVAMMLPTSWPLVRLFARMTRDRRDRVQLVVLLVTGYLAVWSAFGVLVHLGDWGIHHLVETSPWLTRHEWLIGTGTLAIAGLYQFSSLKYRCLDKCRSPFAFIAEHWHGRDAAREALVLGLDHGLFCLGCCWSLMLLMFAVGVGNLAWMFLLASVMAIEKNVSWGKRLSSPLGTLLVAAAVAVALLGVTPFR